MLATQCSNNFRIISPCISFYSITKHPACHVHWSIELWVQGPLMCHIAGGFDLASMKPSLNYSDAEMQVCGAQLILFSIKTQCPAYCSLRRLFLEAAGHEAARAISKVRIAAAGKCISREWAESIVRCVHIHTRLILSQCITQVKLNRAAGNYTHLCARCLFRMRRTCTH